MSLGHNQLSVLGNYVKGATIFNVKIRQGQKKKKLFVVFVLKGLKGFKSLTFEMFI